MNIVELGATSLSVAVLGSLVVAGSHGVRGGAADPVLLLDQQHLRTIHQAMTTFGDRNADGGLPTPGRINRFTSAFVGRQQGAGPANWRKDSTGHLFSAMIAQEYLDTDVVISPGETNPVVSRYGTEAQDDSTEYDYTAYDPPSDTYWMGDAPDPPQVAPGTPPSGGPNFVFRSKINRPPTSGRSHVSYAHLMLAGQRRLDWNVNARPWTVLLGNRGVKNGAAEGDDYDLSPTLRFFGDPDTWIGNVVRGDGRVERLVQPKFGNTDGTPVFGFRDLVFRCGDEAARPDNIFAAEHDSCGDFTGEWKMRDAWIAMNEVMFDGGDGSPRPIAIHDYLRSEP
ncbi:MAG: hypothetical protein VX726_03360 [Planctomycetota bacterium]|nr:hypothetical protein [Planctomycetota bacterium]